MLHSFFSKQFLKFIFVGGSAAVLNWLARYIFNFWFSFHLSILLAFFIGLSSAFILNSIYVFPNSTQSLSHQIKVFTITNLSFLPIVGVFSILLNKLLNYFEIYLYSKEIAHGIALLSPTFLSFLIYKFWGFKDEEKPAKMSGLNK